MDINTIKAKMQMLGNRIVELDIKNDFVYLDLNSEDIQREITITHEITDSYLIEEKYLAKNLVLDIDLKISDIVESQPQNLCVNLKIEGGFCLEEEGTEKDLTDLIEVNGTAALYSIARGIVSSVTSQVCTNGTILLPMINMIELKKQFDSEN